MRIQQMPAVETHRLDADVEAALDRFDELDAPRRRRLNEGERVPLPNDFGLPGVMIAGTGVEVLEYPDGTRTPIIARVDDLLDVLFGYLVSFRRPLTGAELAFVRRYIGKTQAEFANMLNLARETLCRHEKRKGFVPSQVSKLACLIAILASIKHPESPSEEERVLMAKLQDALACLREGIAPASVETIDAGSGVTLELRRQ
jgi:DNA-binding XRE family transcriptional regulator